LKNPRSFIVTLYVILKYKIIRTRQKIRKFLSIKSSFNDYLKLQKSFYQAGARIDRIHSLKIKNDLVIGSYAEHNSWPDYEIYLFDALGVDLKDFVALDFGCGPGRNILRYQDRFRRIDGADISRVNLSNAKKYLKANGLPLDKSPNLFETSGSNLGNAPDGFYDLVFSTICIQHICSHTIRLEIFKDMYRVLKPGGWLSIQMGFGNQSPRSVDYYEDYYGAIGTNREMDTRVTNPEQLKNDLLKLNFKDFSFDIRPTGPGDDHEQWIFFRVKK
jgi:SAM-dependent methyltransferase